MGMGAIICLVAAGTAGSPGVMTPGSDAEPQWSVSLQAGAGRLEEDPAALIYPRLGYMGIYGAFYLSAPLYLRLANLPPQRSPFAQAKKVNKPWLMNWRDTETYAGFIERMDFATRGGELRFVAGRLPPQTLGRGVLVHDYVAFVDPARPRSGAVLKVRALPVGGQAMVDSLLRPHFVAASMDVRPLLPLGWDDDGRFTASVEGAIDLSAPGRMGARPKGGADVGLGYRLGNEHTFAVEPYLASAWLNGAIGGHAGLRLELTGGGAGRGRSSLTMHLEGFAGQAGYMPAYFDISYEAERHRVPGSVDEAKGDLVTPAGKGLRLGWAARLGAVYVGFDGLARLAGGGSGKAFFGWQQDRWQVTAMLAQRQVQQAADLLLFGPSTLARLDATAPLRDGWYAFTAFSLAWRGVGSRSAADWVVGLGYAAGDSVY